MTAPPEAGTFKAAIAKAEAFLRGRLRAGDYGLACVGSDGSRTFADNRGHLFVAAFIAQAMRGRLDEIDRTIILMRILSEEHEGAWGFRPRGIRHDEAFRVFHVDSDDSAYAIRALRWLGVNRAPECLLRFYREAERLFVTFDAPGPTALTVEPSAPNNLLAHPEVNANVYLALKGTHLDHLINFDALAQAQDPEGSWRSYFYPSLLFGTLLATEVLRGHDDAAVERALGFVAGTQNADGSWGEDGDPHETALAISTLAGSAAHADAMWRGVDHLLGAMAADGSWSSSACTWEFHEAGNVQRAYDRHGTYVSARCMTALRRANRDRKRPK